MSKYKRVFNQVPISEGISISNRFRKLTNGFVDQLPFSIDFFDVEAILHRIVSDTMKSARAKKHGLS